MPPIHGPYPYNMSWEELDPEPESLTNPAAKRAIPKRVVESLAWCFDTGSDSTDFERIFDAALALAGRMLTQAEFATWSRGQILATAIDTAIVWERG